jgi:hypothetical protein
LLRRSMRGHGRGSPAWLAASITAPGPEATRGPAVRETVRGPWCQLCCVYRVAGRGRGCRDCFQERCGWDRHTGFADHSHVRESKRISCLKASAFASPYGCGFHRCYSYESSRQGPRVPSPRSAGTGMRVRRGCRASFTLDRSGRTHAAPGSPYATQGSGRQASTHMAYSWPRTSFSPHPAGGDSARGRSPPRTRSRCRARVNGTRAMARGVFPNQARHPLPCG